MTLARTALVFALLAVFAFVYAAPPPAPAETKDDTHAPLVLLLTPEGAGPDSSMEEPGKLRAVGDGNAQKSWQGWSATLAYVLTALARIPVVWMTGNVSATAVPQPTRVLVQPIRLPLDDKKISRALAFLEDEDGEDAAVEVEELEDEGTDANAGNIVKSEQTSSESGVPGILVGAVLMPYSKDSKEIPISYPRILSQGLRRLYAAIPSMLEPLNDEAVTKQKDTLSVTPYYSQVVYPAFIQNPTIINHVLPVYVSTGPWFTNSYSDLATFLNFPPVLISHVNSSEGYVVIDGPFTPIQAEWVVSLGPPMIIFNDEPKIDVPL